MFKTVAQIKAEMQDLGDRVVAIATLAKEENREYTSEEAAEIDSINGSGDKPGKLDDLNTQLQRAEKLEEKQKQIAALRGSKKIESKDESGSPKPRIRVPARAKVHGALKAFAGEKAEENAYVSGRVLAAHIFGDSKSKKWCKENGIGVRTSLSEDSNDRGGIFVPNEMSTAIIRLVEQYGVARRYARVDNMASNTKTIPVRVSGMTAYAVAETKTENEGSNTGTKSQPEYTNIELVARKWKAWLKMSDEVNEDSLVTLADEVAVEAALAFAYSEDNCMFNGDATSTYHGINGILNAVNTGSVHTALSGNTAFSTLDLDDFRTMKGKLPRYPNMQPAWFISPEGYADSMERLLLAANGTLPSDIANGGQLSFLGLPVVLTNVLNSTLTTQVSTKLVVLGDLRMGTIMGVRKNFTMSMTDQRYWDEDQFAIKAIERFDINVHSKGTSSTAGAVMVMATPAS